jgi:hypothetical protein
LQKDERKGEEAGGGDKGRKLIIEQQNISITT